MAEQVLAKLAIQIAANTAQLNSQLKQSQSQFSNFTKSITNIASTLGVAFGVQQVADFALEISKLAGEAKGVKDAFDRLPNSIRLMQDLKQATGGTVSELALMKRTVQAANFGISLEALPKLLQFASIRAQQTGQSVDYLVDSIITGIGRKSPLILDNLGISAVRLKEQFNGASLEAQSIGDVAQAVGRIATQELEKMGSFSENASSKLQRLSAEFDNLKVALGTASNEAGIFGEIIDGTTEFVKTFTNFLNGPGSKAIENYLRYVTFVQRQILSGATSALEALGPTTLDTDIDNVNKLLSDLRFESTEAFKATDQYQTIVGALGEKAKIAGKELILLSDETGRFQFYAKSATVVIQQLQEVIQPETFASLNEEVKNLREQFENTPTNDILGLQNLDRKIEATLLKIENLKNKVAGVRAEVDSSALTSSAVSVTGGDIGTSLPQFSVPELNTKAYTDSLERVKLQTDSFLATMENKFLDFSGVVNSALSGLGQALGSAISGSQNLGDALLGVLGGVLVQLGEMLLTAGIGVEAFKVSLESLNGAVAIAAGIALIALGSALSSSISSLGANPTGGSTASGGGGRGVQAGALNGSGFEIKIGGEFRVKGQDLVYVFNRAQQLSDRTTG